MGFTTGFVGSPPHFPLAPPGTCMDYKLKVVLFYRPEA